MNSGISTIDVILISTPIYQSLIFVVFSITLYLRKKDPAKLMLALFMLVSGVYFFISGIYIHQIYPYFVNAYYFGIPLILSLLPLFYLYIKSLFYPEIRNGKKILLHFGPAILVLLLNFPFLLMSYDEKFNYIIIAYGQSDASLLIKYLTWVNRASIYVVLFLQLLIYSVMFFIRYPDYKKRVEDYYSDTEEIELNWVPAVLVSFTLFFLVLGAYHLIKLPNRFEYRINFNILLTVLSFLIGYFGLLQPTAFGKVADDNPKTDDSEIFSQEEDIIKNKYTRSSLNDGLRDELATKLDQALKVDGMYRNPELTLEDLARTLNTNSKYLSQVINEFYGVNFYTLVNKLRVDYASEIIRSKNSKGFTLTYVGQISGFNSKSTFNLAFKKFTGQTPSDYIKEFAIQRPV
ncbi:MAG: AraC family transcriptional regulator [Bacteroidales bacterium]|nr:AraC family transcriptional regulator [Bacteroidales bacterium]